MKHIMTFLILFLALTDIYSQFIEKSKMDWWMKGNADSIESNWLERKYIVTIDNDTYLFHYPDTSTLIEKGEFIFPRQNYLKPGEYSDSYLTDLELIIMSRTLRNLGLSKMTDTKKEFVRLFSFKENNPIIAEYALDSDSLNYIVTNGFSWTHGQVIKHGSIMISQKESFKIKAKLEDFIRDNLEISGSSDITDFVIEFSVNGTYTIIRLSSMDNRNSKNKDVIKFVKLFEKIMGIQLVEI